MTTQRDEFDAALQVGLEALGLAVPPDLRAKMFAHYEQLIEANRQFNLTRITAPADAAAKHYADSLTLLAMGWVKTSQKLTVLDVGTGAGFPAVPLAVVCKAWVITAIDGTGKKVRFVSSSASALGLRNLTARHARVEDMARHGEAKFDLVLVRAVGKIDQLLPDLAAVRSPGGSIVFYKTDQVDAEVAAAEPVAGKLRLDMEMHSVQLPPGAERLSRKLVRYHRRR